jgi:GlpG protein
MAELLRAPLGDDLRPLSALLWHERIAHRVAEEGGQQVVILQRGEDRERARQLLGRWRRGEVQVTLRPGPGPNTRATDAGPAAALKRTPITALLIALGVLGFLLVYLPAPVAWVATLTFYPFELVDGRPAFASMNGQLWRLVTPVFLHFGWLHITFNALWCWELGRRIEVALGGLQLLGLFLLIACLSNLAQAQVSGPVLFGGLSGVVYGWLAFAWVAGRLNPRWRAMVPASPIMLFMVGWLLVCVTGVIDVLGFSVANAAHVGGLAAGALLGAVFGLAHRVGD